MTVPLNKPQAVCVLAFPWVSISGHVVGSVGLSRPAHCLACLGIVVMCAA